MKPHVVLALAFSSFIFSCASTNPPSHSPYTPPGGSFPPINNPAPTVTHAKLADWWSGKASWTYQYKITYASHNWGPSFGAAHVKVHNGAWYIFTRNHPSNKPDYCKADYLETQVRKSTDKGQSWSAPVTILKPEPGTPWECAIADGDVVFNESTGTFHYLFQCLNRNGGWNGCYVQRTASEPMGEFHSVLSNPVIKGGDIWKKICDSDSDDCVKIPQSKKKVFDEGTFNIFQYDGIHYWVSFHGVDDKGHGFRGIAKTADFQTWIANDTSQGVPTDAIFDLQDTRSWRETWRENKPIGGGAARILKEDNTYYMIVEAADVHLSCIDGQNWDWGAFSTSDLTRTTWDPLPAGNPFLYSSKLPERDGKSIACNPAYAVMFRDGDDYWLHVARESMDATNRGIFFYKLQSDANVLKNGDVWMCDPTGWSRLVEGQTNVAIYRYPNSSSDSNCYLATNCGTTSCAASHGVKQDADISSYAGKKMTYGGKFMVEGTAGNFNLVIDELDSNGVLLASHVLPVTLEQSYTLFQSDFVAHPNVKTARFQIQLKSTNTVRADEMFLRPGN